MSLDRFGSRGFSRTGMGSPAAVPTHPVPTGKTQQNEGGTSFVLGSSPTASAAFHQKELEGRLNRRHQAGEYEFDQHEIRHAGTTSRNPVPSGCFGYRGTGNAENSMSTSQRTIIFIFIVIMGLLGALFKMAYVRDRPNGPKTPRIHRQAAEKESQGMQQVSPSWDRN